MFKFAIKYTILGIFQIFKEEEKLELVSFILVGGIKFENDHLCS